MSPLCSIAFGSTSSTSGTSGTASTSSINFPII